MKKLFLVLSLGLFVAVEAAMNTGSGNIANTNMLASYGSAFEGLAGIPDTQLRTQILANAKALGLTRPELQAQIDSLDAFLISTNSRPLTIDEIPEVNRVWNASEEATTIINELPE